MITPRVGAALIGYFNRPGVSTGIHDELQARALVLDDGQTAIALCSLELLWIRTGELRQIRAAVASRCPIRGENIFIFATHTHSGPAPQHTEYWPDRSLVDRVADAIVTAYESRQPAKLGAGFGQLFDYNINRRWLNRPADPSVGVIRVDTADGRPLAILGNYACHAVVLGYDNLLISGDWPGYSSRLLEAEFGNDFVALFSQGGAGDVNPLTETIRQKLNAGHTVSSIGEISSFYGQYQKGEPNHWNIEDRGGGTFTEAETLALAYNAEVKRIWHKIRPESDISLWTERITVEGAVASGEPPAEGVPTELLEHVPELAEGRIPIEIMLVGIGSIVLCSQPGEVFSETSIEFRKTCQQMGYTYPLLISYANGGFAYLPPANAFSEGGYEVQWPRRFGISRHLQERIAEAITPVLKRHL